MNNLGRSTTMLEVTLGEQQKNFTAICDLLKNSGSSAIYGAGFVGSWAVNYLKSQKISVDYFIDRDAQKAGGQIEGIPIYGTNDPRADLAKVIFIAARHAVPQVRAMYANTEKLLISCDAFYVLQNINEILTLRDSCFADQDSVITLNAILRAMLTGDTKPCREVMVKDMYFCLPEFSATFDEIFVDAGAFVGDTTERFIWENMGTFRHIYAFEPGVKQFSAMQKRLQRLCDEWAFPLSSVSLVQAGLSSQDGQMNCTFTNDFPIRHGLAVQAGTEVNSNNYEVPVFTLDNFLKKREVTFIKVDIEGMEMDFLRGAQYTISTFKPKIAICVYHYPSDLTDILLFLKKLVPEYSFSLRMHAPILGDFVLYASV